MPPPKDLSDDELIQLLESDDPTGFRIPMSIGEAHAELDKCKYVSGYSKFKTSFMSTEKW